jgi:hypothetical protein
MSTQLLEREQYEQRLKELVENELRCMRRTSRDWSGMYRSYDSDSECAQRGLGDSGVKTFVTEQLGATARRIERKIVNGLKQRLSPSPHRLY